MLLGTKVFPTPAPLDIIMDLAAHSQPFLQVLGHTTKQIQTSTTVTRPIASPR